MISNASDYDVQSHGCGASPLGLPRGSRVFAMLTPAGPSAANQEPKDSNPLEKRVPSGTPKLSEFRPEPGTPNLNPTSFVVHTDDWIRWWRWHIGTNWLHPVGPASSLGGRENFAVAHAAWTAALAKSACPHGSDEHFRLAPASPEPGCLAAARTGTRRREPETVRVS
jgi:hypothetical protein